MSIRILLTLFMIFAIPGRPILAWSECGHHIIAGLAFTMLSELDKQTVTELLKSHPLYPNDFVIPDHVKEPEDARLWMVGRASYWPDIAGQYEEWRRPTWHYQLGSTLVLGNVSFLQVPKTPAGMPENSTLATQELHIEQAINLCRSRLRDNLAPPSERALAFSWIAHLVADAHQPCHAGSLYAERVFPEGDRGANLISLGETSNMHSFWDNLLGGRFDDLVVKSQINHMHTDQDLMEFGSQAVQKKNGLVVATWLDESRLSGLENVYTEEILSQVRDAMTQGSSTLDPVTLSVKYVNNAKQVARVRASNAAYRLKAIWAEDLNTLPVIPN